jgi:hypothetical protein
MRGSEGGVPATVGFSGGERVVVVEGPDRFAARKVAALAILLALLGAVVVGRGLSRDHSWVLGRGTSSPAGGQRLSLAGQSAVSAAIGGGAAAYRVTGSGSEREAFNPAQGLNLRFGSSSGVMISSGAVRVGLRLTGAGLGDALSPVGSATSRFQANRVFYDREGLDEWYANDPLGVEQGFTISRAPRGRLGGSLTLSLGVFGNAHAALAGPDGTVTFSQRGSSLRYGGLQARDARGRVLHSWFVLRKGELLIRVDAQRARYPIRIDPLLQQGGEITGGGETGAGLFGSSVAISANGTTAIVGASSDNSGAGAVWIFIRSGLTWTQQGEKITGGGEVGAARFGGSVALSANGNTALVGGSGDNTGMGAAWVFTRSEGKWTQQGEKFTDSEAIAEGYFGISVALSAEGNTALIGGGAASEGTSKPGAARIFTRSEGKWTQLERLEPSEETKGAEFGCAVALSGDGHTALIGGDANGVPGLGRHGAAWVFTNSEGTWEQQGSDLTPFDEAPEDEPEFGDSVALSNNGNTALIGGQNDRGAPGEGAGAAWVYTREKSSWSRQEKLNSVAPKYNEKFGNSVSLSASGNTALVGAWGYGVEGVRATWVGAWRSPAKAKRRSSETTPSTLLKEQHTRTLIYTLLKKNMGFHIRPCPIKLAAFSGIPSTATLATR